MNNQRRHPIYIWQDNEWPCFRWDAEALLEPLSRLNRIYGQLNGQMSMLGFDEKSLRRLSAMTDDLIGSSEIEGVILNPQSVRSSIARRLGVDDCGVFIEDHYVDGLVDVMLDAIGNCRLPLTEERMFGWHAALFPTGRSGMYRITVADWRKGGEPMQVVSGAFGKEKVHYEAPASVDVPAEMARFIEWCNSTTTADTAAQSPFITAAIAHLWFVSIHPFDDGNGRICRTLTDMILARLDDGNARYYSVSAEINRNKKSYYDVLEQTQKGGMDITPWLLWFFDCIENAIRRTLSTVDKTIDKAAYWDRFRDIDINERQRKIINRLWDGFDGKLTSSKWAKMCSCSQDTALRDINDLIRKGMLSDSGEGGRNKNYLLTK